MREIEAKILDIDKEDIIDRLEKMGATLVFDGEIETYFFDDDNHTLKNRDSLLRLRKMGDRAFLTYKDKISKEDVKVYEEKETFVEDFDEMLSIIKSMGFKEKKVVKKKRKSFQKGNTKFEIDKFTDEFSDIPEFLEIEAESKESIHDYAEKLGFSKDDCTSRSTGDIIRDYEKIEKNTVKKRSS